MSELAHHDTEIPTHKATEINVQNVIPLPRKKGEVIAFNELSELGASTMFMSRLRHESRSALHGDTLALVIEEHLGQKYDLEVQTLQARLSQIVRGASPSDEIYDHRLDNDPVFRLITDKLVSKDSKQNSTVQRAAARKMLDLRVSLPQLQTSDDETWIDVTQRLFS